MEQFRAGSPRRANAAPGPILQAQKCAPPRRFQQLDAHQIAQLTVYSVRGYAIGAEQHACSPSRQRENTSLIAGADVSSTFCSGAHRPCSLPRLLQDAGSAAKSTIVGPVTTLKYVNTIVDGKYRDDRWVEGRWDLMHPTFRAADGTTDWDKVRPLLEQA